MDFKQHLEKAKVKPLDKWQKKDKDIQMAQAVNLAVQEACAKHESGCITQYFKDEMIKASARKYNKILTELKLED